MLENKFFRRSTSGRTSKPEEVIDASEQLHSHVVVDQGVLQHARLQAQVSHVFPHPPLAAFLVVPEIEQRGRRREGKQQLQFSNDTDFRVSSRTASRPSDISHTSISIHMHVRRYARIYILYIYTHTHSSISLLAGGWEREDCVELR